MILSVGHSTRQADEFLALLTHHGIRAVADVRRFPGSRRHPQFGREALGKFLAAHDIEYHWIAALGGRRRSGAVPDNGWRNPSFAAYAEYVGTPDFSTGLATLIECGQRVPTTMMCAELLWWRCHRRIISDVLLARGIDVTHILDEAHVDTHSLTPPARLIDGHLTYRAD